MSRLLTNIKYKARTHFNWSLWFLGIHSATMTITYYALIKTSVISSAEGALFYRLWTALFFLFGTSIKFREDYNFFLSMSSTRQEVYRALTGVTLIFSASFGFLMVLEKHLVDSINRALGFLNPTDPFHFLSPYTSEDIVLPFLFFFTLSALCSLSGVFLGSVFYRFGKKFTLIFWLLFSSIPLLILPLSLLHKNAKENLIETWRVLKIFDLASASGLLAGGTLLLAIALYINIRKLPQK